MCKIGFIKCFAKRAKEFVKGRASFDHLAAVIRDSLRVGYRLFDMCIPRLQILILRLLKNWEQILRFL